MEDIEGAERGRGGGLGKKLSSPTKDDVSRRKKKPKAFTLISSHVM